MAKTEKVEQNKPSEFSTDKSNIAEFSSDKPNILKTEYKDDEGTLIYSDCPEYVKSPGILYSDVVSGKVRVFYYHLNESKKPAKVAVILESTGRAAAVHVEKAALGKVLDDYCKLGRGIQEKMLLPESDRDDLIIVDSVRGKLLDKKMDSLILEPNYLVEGFYDFEVKGKVKLTVFMYPVKADPFEFLAAAEQLPAEKEQREGTFPSLTRIVKLKKRFNPRTDGVSCIEIGTSEGKAWLKGYSAMSKKDTENFGNYGLNYKLAFHTTSVGKTHYYLEPLGGIYSGVMKAHYGYRGRKTKLIFVPENEPHFGEKGIREFADLGVYDNSEPLWFDYAVPAASNMPVRIWLVPEKDSLSHR